MSHLIKLGKEYAFLVSFFLIIALFYFSWFNKPGIFHYVFNPDFLHVSFFSDALFADIHATNYWYVTPSPYIFPDILYFGIINTVIKNNHITYFIILFTNFVLINLALFKLHRLFFTHNIFTILIYNILILLLFIFGGFDQFIYLNQFVPVNHLSSFICFAFLLRKEIKIDRYLPFWLICISLVTFSDPVFILYFLPIQMMLSFKLSMIWRHVVTVLFCIAALLLFRYAYKSMFLKAINGQTIISMNYEDSINEFWTSIIPFFSFPTFIVLLALISISFLSIFFKGRLKFIAIYLIFIVPILEFGMGFIMGFDTMRYFTGSIFFGALMGLSLLLKPLNRYTELIRFNNKFTILGSLLVIILVFGFKFYNNSFYIGKPAQVICIENYAKELDVDFVIADYWNAKPLMYFNTDNLVVLQFTNNMHDYVHEFDVRIFEHFKGKENVKGIVYSAGIDLDSINVYRDMEIKGIPCHQDSIFVINKNPLK